MLKVLKAETYSTNEDKSCKDLSEDLAKLQRHMLASDQKISLIVQIDGWESAGRGKVMLEVMRELDQRYVRAFSLEEPSSSRWPYLHALWAHLPEYGHASIFSRSIYKPLFHSIGLNEDKIAETVESFRDTAQTLYDDNFILVKIFLDISEETQKSRINQFYRDPTMRLYVGPEDIWEHRRYKAMRKHYDKILELTNFPCSPWKVISAEDLKAASRETLRYIIAEVEKGLERIEGTSSPTARTNREKICAAEPATQSAVEDLQQPRNYQEEKYILERVKPQEQMSQKDYKTQLEDLQKEAAAIQLRLKARGIPTVIVFEGMDAAGKGGSIKRLMRLMDPRYALVSTTAAPSPAENAHHYLWRFYQEFPEYGNLTVFDRSWYGRVLVERVEGFACPAAWERAYEEINRMEKELYQHHCLIFKYYIHVDKEEQKKRFEERQNDPEKHYKITAEDWRNRDKWELYQEAANEMLARTSTEYAPWRVVPGNNKRYARIFILKDFITGATAALEKIQPWADLGLEAHTL